MEEEKRKRRCFRMSLPVSVRLEDEGRRVEISGVTRDLSSGGAFLFLEAKELPEFKSAKFVLQLPAEVTLAEPAPIDCRARVLRIDRGASGLIGIAVQISEFQFLSRAEPGRGSEWRHIPVGP